MPPTGKNWMNFLYVNLGFISIISIMIYYISVKEIKKNWGKYRCNPMFMVFSDNIADDFKTCITTVQNHSIGPLLTPITSNVSDLQQTSAQQSNQIKDNTDSINNLGFSMDMKMTDIGGQFSNSSAEMQKVTYGIKDLMSKLSAISVSMMYILDGNAKTMKSAWNGPPGQVMRKLGSLGHCFHPNTKIKLKNGETVKMQDVKLGSTLENGSRVVSVMQIDNTINPEPLYKISDIYVTGSHLIKEEGKFHFIPVKDHPHAIKQTQVKSDVYSCLITDTHLIKVGDYMFWDWEDYYCEFV